MRWSPSCRSNRKPSFSNTRMRSWKVDWPDRRHLKLFDAHREAVHCDEFRRQPVLAVLLVTSLLEDLCQRPHLSAGCQKAADGIADVAAGFLVGRAAARQVKRGHVCDVCIAFLEDMGVERKVPHTGSVPPGLSC